MSARKERKYSGRKALMHKVCQRRTKQALRRGRKLVQGTGKDRVRTWRVRNTRTKREVTVTAATVAQACELAMTEHKLSKSVDKLSAVAV